MHFFRTSKICKLFLLTLIVSILNGCTSIPDLQNKIIAHAQKEETAQHELDKRFKSECSQGKEIYNLPRDKVTAAVECGSPIFDETFIEQARYEELALELKQYLISQSALYTQKKINKGTFKKRWIGAWNTYNEEWIKRSKGEVIDTTARNEQFSNIAAGAVVVVAVVGLVALAAAGGGGGGGGNSYAGNCPCPYSVDAAGNQCGARSAYSRSGGASPVCY